METFARVYFASGTALHCTFTFTFSRRPLFFFFFLIRLTFLLLSHLYFSNFSPFDELYILRLLVHLIKIARSFSFVFFPPHFRNFTLSRSLWVHKSLNFVGSRADAIFLSFFVRGFSRKITLQTRVFIVHAHRMYLLCT